MKYRTWLTYDLDSRKEPKEVCNLGWLLRNWKIVKSFTLEETEELSAGYRMSLLVAYMEPNARSVLSYSCYFMEWTIAENFLKRPVFFGLKLNGKIISKA